MQLHIRQKQDPVTLYLEGQKESYLSRAAQETPFMKHITCSVLKVP